MTSYNGVDLVSLSLGGSDWFTASDGSWAVTMEGIVAGHEVVIPAGGGNCNLSLQQPSNWPSTYPLATLSSGGNGTGITQVANLYTYRDPSSYAATTGSASSPSDATDRVTLYVPATITQPGVAGYLLDSGPPKRYQVAPNNASAYAFVDNPTGAPVLIQSVVFTMDLWIQIAYYPPAVFPPPASPTQPPPGTSTLNPTTTARRQLEQANPGYTVRWTRRNRFPDFAAYGLGLRAQLTIPFAGFVNRGNLITGLQIDYVASNDPPSQDQKAVYTFQKIPGTILPGAGTSSSSQDAAGTGAEVPAYLIIDDGTHGTGIGLGGLG